MMVFDDWICEFVEDEQRFSFFFFLFDSLKYSNLQMVVDVMDESLLEFKIFIR